MKDFPEDLRPKKGGLGGRHKIRGRVRNRKKRVRPRELQAQTMSPRTLNPADKALGALRGY
jgi:hypothetical protein